MNSAQEQRISVCISAIPSGKVASYGQIASLAGLRRGHRQVARFIRTQQDPDLPWHRLIRADGKPGLPEDSRTYHTQISRLKAEGILLHKGRVDMQRFQWQPDLDFILFHPEL